MVGRLACTVDRKILIRRIIKHGPWKLTLRATMEAMEAGYCTITYSPMLTWGMDATGTQAEEILSLRFWEGDKLLEREGLSQCLHPKLIRLEVDGVESRPLFVRAHMVDTQETIKLAEEIETKLNEIVEAAGRRDPKVTTAMM